MTQEDWQTLRQVIGVIPASEAWEEAKPYPFLCLCKRGVQYAGINYSWVDIETISAEFSRKTKGKHYPLHWRGPLH